MRDVDFQFYLLWKRGIIRVHAAQFFAWQNIFPIVVIPQGLTLFPKKESIKGGSVPKRLLSLYVFFSLGFHSLFVTFLVLRGWWNFLCETYFFPCWNMFKGWRKDAKNGEKIGDPGPSSAVKGPWKFALSWRCVFFLDHTSILLIFSCTFGLIKRRRRSSVTFQNFPVII